MVLKSRVHAPDWSAGDNPDKEAKCRKHPLPTHHDVENDPWFSDEKEAVHICNGTYDGKVCPFRDICTYISLRNNEQFGAFGGLTAEQRKWVRKNYKDKELWKTPDAFRDKVPTPEYFEELRALAGKDDDEEEIEAAED